MDGHLEWSIKLSLLLYATTAPGGGMRAEGVTSESGRFFFPETPSDAPGHTFGGSVALFAHHGMPITTFASLRARPDLSDRWVLEMSPDEGPAVAAFALGTPRTTDGVLEFTDVALTEIGSEMFGGYYGAGEPFDPLLIRPARG